MKFKDIVPESVKALPGKTEDVMEKLREFFTDQLPKPYWDEYSDQEVTDSPDPGSVHSVTDGQSSEGISFDVDISFSTEPHAAIVEGVAMKIQEFGGIGLNIRPTVNNHERTRPDGSQAYGLRTTSMNFRDGQSHCLVVVSTWDTGEFNPRHELHFRRRQRPH